MTAYETQTSKFKTGNGNYFTQSLFYEMSYGDTSNVLYTLKREDYKGYPSIYRLYMNLEDPTEYAVATKYFDGWAHWQLLTGLSWFKEHLEEWRAEMEVKLRAKALANIAAIAGNIENKNSITANRFLFEKGFLPSITLKENRRGRPKKEDIEAAIKLEAREALELAADANRLQLRVVS